MTRSRSRIVACLGLGTAFALISSIGCGGSDDSGFGDQAMSTPTPQNPTQSDSGSTPTLGGNDAGGGGAHACDDSAPNGEGCSCTPGAQPRACYPGPAAQAGVGQCTKGTQTCNATKQGEFTSGVWGACQGAGKPTTCADQKATCGTISDGCGGQLQCGDVCATCSPGSITFSTPGPTTFTVPKYQTMKVEVWGAGGGGTAYQQINAPTNGGDTSFNGTVVAGGGKSGSSRAGGTASGGSTNTPGGAGGPACDMGPPVLCGDGPGGNSPNGGAGGGGPTGAGPCGGGDGQAGTAPGGGGAGTWTCQGQWQIGQGWGMSGAGGGAGAYASISYAAGQIAAGTQAAIVVGAGGTGSQGSVTAGDSASHYTGGSGAAGQVKITWTCQ